MKLTKYLQFFLLSITMLYSCMGGGTHGSIKCYQYQISKSYLENAIRKVIASNPNNIIQDSVKSYYNDDTTYITIKVFEKEEINKYILRFGGDKEYWDKSNQSSVFIAYAYNKNGEGGSEGNGGVKWFHIKLKKKLTSLFERGFIDKIDKELNVKHTVCN